MIQAAIAGYGLVLASNVLVSKSLEQGVLKALFPQQILPWHELYYALYRTGRQRHSAVATLLSWLGQQSDLSENSRYLDDWVMWIQSKLSMRYVYLCINKIAYCTWISVYFSTPPFHKHKKRPVNRYRPLVPSRVALKLVFQLTQRGKHLTRSCVWQVFCSHTGNDFSRIGAQKWINWFFMA